MPATASGAARPVLVDARLDKSVVGPSETCWPHRARSEFEGKADTVAMPTDGAF
jgi:hypothetical protein